jgi:PAS domain S-box-containing protein
MTKPLNILIVEDSEDDAILLLRELRKGGYEPVSERVETPEAMKAALEKGKWDIVISDYVLPGFSGLAALSLLKESGQDLPFIVVSGNIGEDIAVGAMKAGAHDYIIKGKLARLVPAVDREIRDADVRREKRQAEEALRRSYEELERRVEDRTTKLKMALDESRQHQEALRESEQRLNRSQEIAHLGSWELDLVNNRLYWSDEVYRIFGLQPQEFGATYEAFIEAGHPDDRTAVNEAYSGSLREGRDSYEIEHRVVRKAAGEVRIVHEKCDHIRDDSGRIIRSVGMVHDITERKKLEEDRERLLHELMRSNKELEQFAYIASHDLQEPLRMVSSFVQLLGHRYKGRLDEDADEFIGYAVNGAAHMQRLLNDLLAYSRVGMKGEPFKLIDLKSALDKAIINLKVEIDHTCAEIIHESLPIVYADEVQMVQVFQNLLGNAMKFSNAGPPRINVSAEMKDDEWVICVQDNGIGIDPKYFGRIFHIFKRLHSKEEYRGTGIGLAICKKIIERHNGRIWVESELGKGASFYFTIPANPISSPPTLGGVAEGRGGN